MIGRIAAMMTLVAAPSTFAVGYWQGEHSQPEASPLTVQVNAPVIAKPGIGAADAASYFAELNVPPPPPPPPPSALAAARPLPPPGPPPIDVGVEFRRDVTAVLTGSQPHVVLAGGRKLAKGEVYRDGWRVRDLTAQTAVLSKGRDTRSINLFSAPPREATVQVASVSPVIAGPLALSNGVTAEQRAADLARQMAAMSPDQRRAFVQSQLGGQFGGRGGGGQFGGGDGGGRGRRGEQGPNGGFGGRGGGGGGGGQGQNSNAPRINSVIIPPPPPPPMIQGANGGFGNRRN